MGSLTNYLRRSCRGVFLTFLLPSLTKDFIMTRFSQNCVSKVRIICQPCSIDRTVVYVVIRNIASKGPRCFPLKALYCCECSVETVLKRIVGE